MGDPRPPSLWPSEASAVITNKYGETEVVGKCRRAIYLRYVADTYAMHGGSEELGEFVKTIKENTAPPDTYMRWIWKAGELYEEYVVQIAKDSGVYIDSQVGIWVNEFRISGKIDLIVINPDTSKLAQVEIKSVYGFGSNAVIGSPGGHKKGIMGEPRDSNLMQVALYQWHFANKRPEFEAGRLVYGARDTGRFAEYAITVDDDGNIYYAGITPVVSEPIKSPITIPAILEAYKYVQEHIDNGTLPPRDFDLQYSDEKILVLYERKELTKAEMERVEKRQAQIAAGKEKINMQIERGDFNCSWCQMQRFCYSENGTPKEV